jgi:hypothetical protein
VNSSILWLDVARQGNEDLNQQCNYEVNKKNGKYCTFEAPVYLESGSVDAL